MLQAHALGWTVHVDEVFAHTHVRKGTNQFVDERSRNTHEEFSTRLSQVRFEHGSAPTPDDASNEDDDIHIHSIVPLTQPRPSASHVVPQQPTSVQPTSVQPTSVQPTPVQPTPVQPSIEQQDDEDHSDDDYVDY
ncbi:hypothetical protein LR48_Vigan252s001200 [Vigna angularis]|uniref:Uncharacterized protein n=1 Tax=Phaseolus angularis TaxID=3914 RepID=A0A0L9T6S0_PHAAN|nr:hypothetical protein LR48_Vigan252s001200 [Vigna angularis]